MADFQYHLDQLAARGVSVVAASTDPIADAEKIAADQKLRFRIGYGLDPEVVSAATGAFYDAEDEEPYLHATSFIVNDSGTVETAIYSTGSLGRLTAEDALRYTKHLPVS